MRRHHLGRSVRVREPESVADLVQEDGRKVEAGWRTLGLLGASELLPAHTVQQPSLRRVKHDARSVRLCEVAAGSVKLLLVDLGVVGPADDELRVVGALRGQPLKLEPTRSRTSPRCKALGDLVKQHSPVQVAGRLLHRIRHRRAGRESGRVIDLMVLVLKVVRRREGRPSALEHGWWDCRLLDGHVFLLLVDGDHLYHRICRGEAEGLQPRRHVDTHVKRIRVLAVRTDISLTREDAAQPRIVGVVHNARNGGAERWRRRLGAGRVDECVERV
mmetsp:Transcript_16420/g.48202  ORF Transcript_16420/g.48202 Transcript_16420/m.48202 type:complete len:274 (-) Transcript_16420:1496-2317(-)